MKKNLTLFIILPLLVLISACKKSNNVVIPNQTIYVKLLSSGWVLDNTNNQDYLYTFDLPELQDNDGIIASINFGAGFYEALPEVYQGVSFSYNVGQGSMQIIAQDPILDTTIELKRPSDATLKIVIIPSAE